MKNNNWIKVKVKKLKLPIQMINWEKSDNQSQFDKTIVNKYKLTKTKCYNKKWFLLLFLWYVIKEEFNIKNFYLNIDNFYKYWKKIWYSRQFLKRIWTGWFEKNKQFLINNNLIRNNDETKLYLFPKNNSHSFYILNNSLINYWLQGSYNFNELITAVYASSPTVIRNENYIKDKENIFGKKNNEKFLSWNVISKTLSTIGLATWTTMYATLKRLNKIKSKLNKTNKKQIFKIKKRYKKINWYIAQLSNIYLLDWTNKIKNKFFNYKNENKQISSNNLFFVNQKKLNTIRSKTIYSWFESKKEKINKIIQKCNYKIYKISENIKNKIWNYTWNDYENLKEKILQEKNDHLSLLKNIKTKINWMPKENYIYYNNWFN